MLISHQLGFCDVTAEAYRAQIMRKMGADTIVDLLVMACICIAEKRLGGIVKLAQKEVLHPTGSCRWGVFLLFSENRGRRRQELFDR